MDLYLFSIYYSIKRINQKIITNIKGPLIEIAEMCGIIAFVGKEDGRKFVLEGLKKLDYRGYDSWGIAGVNNDELWHYKTTGLVKTELIGKESHIIIGHTRWCTHGKVTKENAHPHVSNDEKIAAVHNGIIDNYLELKEMLEKEGYKFYSDTDTEVIPNLISYYTNKNPEKNFIEGFKQTIKQLKGSFAIAALHEKTLAFARVNSPLLIGVAEGEIYIASDAAPFLEKTNKAVFLNEGDWGYYEKGNMYLFDKNEKPIEAKTEEIHWQYNEQGKNGYSHFMLKEIYEQVNTIVNAAAQPNIQNAKDEIKKFSEILLVGSGTSYNACLAGASFLSKKNIKAIPVLASEYQLHVPFFDKEKIMIIVSQSGETADLIEVVNEAKNAGMKIIGIINVPGSTLWRKSDILLGMNAGQEIGVASTKAYTSTLTIFSLLAGEKIDETELSKYTNEKIKEWHEQAKELIQKIKKDLFVIGKEEALSYAMETALKVKEISYIRAEGLAAGELKHGTLALIEEDVPVISIATKETRQDLINNALEIKSRGGFIIGIDSKTHPCYDYFISCKYPILSIIPGQLLAYELAISKGYNPDKPRNLAKSVTVK